MPTFADYTKPLTPRQQRFVAAYTTCGNASKAAREAGYCDAKNEGYRLVRRPHIAKVIQARMQTALEAQPEPMTPEELVIRLTQRARSSMEPFLQQDEQGRVRLSLESEEARDSMDTVRRFKHKRVEHAGGTEDVEEIVLYDALPALLMLGRIYGFDEMRPNKAPRDSPSISSSATVASPPKPDVPNVSHLTREEAREELAKLLKMPIEMMPAIEY